MITFEPYNKLHLPYLISVFKSNMPKYFLEHELTDFIKFLDDPGNYFVMKKGNDIVACGGYYLNNNNTVSLCWGMVSKELHHTGLGKELLEFRMNCIHEDYPGKDIVNITSQYTTGFFEKYNFKITSVEKDGFGPGLDACKMIYHSTFNADQ